MPLNPKLITGTIVLLLNLIATTAVAQSYDFNQSQFKPASEARLTLAIPFGTERKDYKSQPRVAFSVRQYTQENAFNNDWMLKPSLQKGFVENGFAISLSKAPQLSLNGQALYFNEAESAELDKDVKTAGKIALGAGLVVVAVGVVSTIVLLTGDHTSE